MPNSIFERAEYERRLAATRQAMARQGIDCLVVSEPANMFYLTGYDAWSFYTPQVLLVAQDEDAPFWMGRYMDMVSASDTTFLPPGNIHSYSDDYVQAADRHPMQRVAALMKEKGWGSKTLGVEMGAYYYTARIHAELQAALPSARFVDAELLVNWIRLKKSAAELAYMRQAGRIADRVVAAAVERAAPGVRECDVVAEIYKAQMAGCEEFGGVYVTSPPQFCAGPRIRTPHGLWTDERLQPDAPFNMEVAASRLHYHSPISRTVYLGVPPPAYLKLAGAVIDGLNATLDGVRPGMTCEQVEETWRKTIARHGFEKEARVGYSIGIGFPPTWGERTASLRAGDRTELEPGMAFHLMTGLWLENTGVTITQSFVVTDKGHEALTTYPRELIVKK